VRHGAQTTQGMRVDPVEGHEEFDMKVAASLELVWQLAAREAKALDWETIEPEHFGMALTKLAEVPVQDVERIVSGAEAAKELARDVKAVRDLLQEKNIDGQRARRTIRAKLGKGNAAGGDGRMHRSDASRSLFNTAAKLADEGDGDTLTPAHLLEALLATPTDIMAQALEEAPAVSADARRAATPLLTDMGEDLTELARQGKLRGSGRRAECNALLTALAGRESGCVFLISDKDDTVRAVVAAAAQSIAAGRVPQTLKRQRIIDITLHGPRGTDTNKWKAGMQGFLKEALGDGKTILFWPPVASADPDIPLTLQLLEPRAGKEVPRIICRLPSDVYEKYIKSVSQWKLQSQTIWIRDEEVSVIPMEL